MTRRLYTKQTHKHPVRFFFTGLGGLILCGMLVWTWEPDAWWKEAAVLVTGYLSVLIIGSWIFKNLKTGWVVSSGIFGLLILNRLEILDSVSAALLILVLVLIALVN